MFFELIQEAITTLKLNILRTVLTMIGIILGVGAVVTIMNLGQSAYVTAENMISDSGFGNITITNFGGSADALPLNRSTINILESAQIDGVTAYNPKFSDLYGTIYNPDDESIFLAATYENPDVVQRRAKLIAGNHFTQDDVASQSLVIVIDRNAAEKLYSTAENAIGKSVRYDTEGFYRIIGVFENESMFITDMGYGYLPISLGELNPYFQSYGYNSVSVDTELGVDFQIVADAIEQALLEAYGFADADEMPFRIQNVQDIMGEVFMFLTAFSIGLSLIAAISLLVGGVGVMNIMLVNVTERTKEIGLMKALGAKDNDIIFQFLVEAIVMSICGGLAGVALGVSVSWAIITGSNTFAQGVMPEFTFTIDYRSIILSVVVSTLIGLIFGAYPAKKAAKLDPVDALRRD